MFCTLITLSLLSVLSIEIYDNTALFSIIVRHRTGYKPLSKTMMTQFIEIHKRHRSASVHLQLSLAWIGDCIPEYHVGCDYLPIPCCTQFVIRIRRDEVLDHLQNTSVLSSTYVFSDSIISLVWYIAHIFLYSAWAALIVCLVANKAHILCLCQLAREELRIYNPGHLLLTVSNLNSSID